MRRKDREITDPAKIEAILQRCTCCRVGFWDGKEVYIVPLNFGYEKTDGSYTLYFHGAKEGRKVDLIERYPHVGFEMDTDFALQQAEIACGFSARFLSIIGSGEIAIVTDPAEKLLGLACIMQRYTGKDDWTYNEKMLDATAVFRIRVTELCGKEHE